MTDTQRTSQRTRMAGTLRPEDVGSTQRVTGWVHRRRDLGGLYFLDLRDRSGLLQLSFGPDWTDAESLEAVREIGPETVIAAEGEVSLRPDPNPELATGAVEVQVRSLDVVNPALNPAIAVYRPPEEEPPSEELRLRHRMLDLRNPELQRTLELRHRLVLDARNYLSAQGFLEIRDPYTHQAHAGGGSRLPGAKPRAPGQFYALPQSPQLYKQILMVAGFDRYFQIARCFRDEDLRGRPPTRVHPDRRRGFIRRSRRHLRVDGGSDDVARRGGWDRGAITLPAPDLAGVDGPLRQRPA